MKAEIAVVTVSGKAYYLIVNELKKRNVPFLSLTPHEPVPLEIRAVITTRRERPLVKHERVLVYEEGTEPESLVNETLQALRGKEYFEKVVVGVDPGEVFGLAVLGDGKVIETANCLGAKETLDKIKSILKNVGNNPITQVSIKVGDGVPARKEELLDHLDRALPSTVMLESVREAGTNWYINDAKRGRRFRHMVSAIRIAGRDGSTFHRRKNT